MERQRLGTALIHEAEKEMRIGDLLQQIESKTMMLSMQCETEDEVAAAWAAVSTTTSQSMKTQLYEIGGDVSRVMQQLDRFLLINQINVTIINRQVYLINGQTALNGVNPFCVNGTRRKMDCFR